MAVKILHANRQIKSLKVVMFVKTSIESLLDMINANPFISTLILLGSNFKANSMGLKRLARERPMLEVLRFHFFPITADDAIMLIRQLRSLKLFEFLLRDTSERDRLVNQLDNEWQPDIRIDSPYRTLKLTR